MLSCITRGLELIVDVDQLLLHRCNASLELINGWCARAARRLRSMIIICSWCARAARAARAGRRLRRFARGGRGSRQLRRFARGRGSCYRHRLCHRDVDIDHTWSSCHIPPPAVLTKLVTKACTSQMAAQARRMHCHNHYILRIEHT